MKEIAQDLGGENPDNETRAFAGWRLGIAKNVLLQGYRKSSYDALRARSQSPSERRPDVLDCPDPVTTICTRPGKDDAIQRFLAYVGELDAGDRMFLLYCGFEEYTCAEAATRMSVSPEATTKRWQTLPARLRENGPCRALALEAIT